MGLLKRFECPGCGYPAQVSGGRDGGMIAAVQTMTCADCVAFVDVVVGWHDISGPTSDPARGKELGACPACRGRRGELWPAARPCPRCRTTSRPRKRSPGACERAPCRHRTVIA